MTQTLNRMRQNEKNRHKNRPCKWTFILKVKCNLFKRRWWPFLREKRFFQMKGLCSNLAFSVYRQFTNLFYFDILTIYNKLSVSKNTILYTTSSLSQRIQYCKQQALCLKEYNTYVN